MKSRAFLEYVYMGAFGRYVDKMIGPFGPGLNVVYGKNETGKTTTAAFVCGVLFNWEDARGMKNAYKHTTLDRFGSLHFKDVETGSSLKLSRNRKIDDLECSPKEAVSLLATIDKETFKTVFSLSSDELRGLSKAGEVTSKLLTAGSGTLESPASALAKLDARIASFTSRSAQATHSLVVLKRELDDCRQKLSKARAESDADKEDDFNLAQLQLQRAGLNHSLSLVHADIEELTAAIARLKQDGHRMQQLRADVAVAAKRLQAAEAEYEANTALLASTPCMDAAQERALRMEFASLEEERQRIMNRIDAARDAFETAKARYNACSLGNESQSATHQRKAKATSSRIFMVGSVLFMLAGVACMIGMIFKPMESLAFAAALLLVASALCGVFGFAFKVKPQEGDHDERAQSAALRQVMIEQRLKWESCETEELFFNEKLKEKMNQLGFEASVVSIKHVSTFLDRMHDNRLAAEDAAKKVSSEKRNLLRIQQELNLIDARCVETLQSVGFPAHATTAQLEERLLGLSQQRNEMAEQLQDLSAAHGALRQKLAMAEADHGLDDLKLKKAQLVTRYEDSLAELVKLLVARRALAQAIEAWEGESQPEVYARASELLGLMTEGAWVKVQLDESGSIVVVDSVGNTRHPRYLSLGTCQQLYLALRLALLECVKDVGASIPVLADDILVNFDDERRIGAIKALGHLSQQRQVIMFTCHKEVVDLVQRHHPKCTLIHL